MRVAEITTRIVRVIEVPCSQLADFIKMPEAQQVGVYFLIMAGKFPAPWGGDFDWESYPKRVCRAR